MTPSRTGVDLALSATLAVLVACIVTSCVALAQHLTPGWDGAPLVFICSLTAVESYSTHGRVAGEGSNRLLDARSRLAELAALFVLVQLWVDLQDGNPVVIGWVPHLDTKAGLLFIPVFLIWAACGSVADIIAQLRRPLDTLAAGPQLVAPERRLAARFLAGGLLLFVAAGLTQPSVASFIHLPRANEPGPVVNVLVYFLLGMPALGWVHYATLRQRWQHQQVTVTAGLQSRWLQYSLAFLALMVVLAFLLPTSQAAGLLDPWRQAWDQVVLVFRGPLEWLVRLLGQTSQLKPHEHLPTVTPPPHFRHPPAPHHGGSLGRAGWGTLLQALFFWGVVAAAAIYILRTYARGKLRGLRMPGRLGIMFTVMGRMLGVLRRLLRGYADALVDLLPVIRVARPHGVNAASGFRRLVSIGAITPREQAMRYYLTTVRRAEHEGFHRLVSQTPYEFDSALAARLPEVGEDMGRLTDAFVEARYSRHAIEAERLGPLRASWQRVRQALRGLRRSG